MIRDLMSLASPIIESLFPDKTEQKKQKLKLERLNQEGKLKRAGAKVKIILAHLNSKHKWVALARPAFFYIIYFLILFAIPMGILSAFDPVMAANIEKGVQAWFEAIPKLLWEIFAGLFAVNLGKDSYDNKKMMESMERLGIDNE